MTKKRRTHLTTRKGMKKRAPMMMDEPEAMDSMHEDMMEGEMPMRMPIPKRKKKAS